MKALTFALALLFSNSLLAQAEAPNTEKVTELNMNYGFGRQKVLSLKDLATQRFGTTVANTIKTFIEQGWDYNKAHVLSLCAANMESLEKNFDMNEKDSTVRDLPLAAAIVLVDRSLMIVPMANLYSETRNGENVFVRLIDNGPTTNNDFQIGYSLIRNEMDSNLSIDLPLVKIINNGGNSKVSFNPGKFMSSNANLIDRMALKKVHNKVSFTCKNMDKVEDILNN